MSDIKQKLRDHRGEYCVHAYPVCIEAAAHIEKLETRLEIIDGIDGITRRDVRIAELEAELSRREITISTLEGALERARDGQGESVDCYIDCPDCSGNGYVANTVTCKRCAHSGIIATQLYAAPPDADKVRDAALEEAARVCDGVMSNDWRGLGKRIRALKSAAPSTAVPELPATDDCVRPDLIEKLTYHAYERDDMTIDELLQVLSKERYRKVHQRTHRQLELQLLALLAGAAPTQQAQPVEQVTIGGDGFFAGMIANIDETLPSNTVEMRSGTNRMQLNTSTGEITKISAQPAERKALVVGDAGERELFAQSMVKAGFHNPDIFKYERDSDRYEGWQLARALSPAPSEQDKADAEHRAQPERKEWMDCESRGPWTRNSLAYEVNRLKQKAISTRNAYEKDYMRMPCEYISDACSDAADLIKSRLDAIAARTSQGEANG